MCFRHVACDLVDHVLLIQLLEVSVLFVHVTGSFEGYPFLMLALCHASRIQSPPAFFHSPARTWLPQCCGLHRVVPHRPRRTRSILAHLCWRRRATSRMRQACGWQFDPATPPLTRPLHLPCLHSGSTSTRMYMGLPRKRNSSCALPAAASALSSVQFAPSNSHHCRRASSAEAHCMRKPIGFSRTYCQEPNRAGHSSSIETGTKSSGPTDNIPNISTACCRAVTFGKSAFGSGFAVADGSASCNKARFDITPYVDKARRSCRVHSYLPALRFRELASGTERTPSSLDQFCHRSRLQCIPKLGLGPVSLRVEAPVVGYGNSQ